MIAWIILQLNIIMIWCVNMALENASTDVIALWKQPRLDKLKFLIRDLEITTLFLLLTTQAPQKQKKKMTQPSQLWHT